MAFAKRSYVKKAISETDLPQRIVAMEKSKTSFILRGFTQESEYRIFEFEGIASDRTRSSFTVRIDMALSRRYGIRLQELPLLCREILDRSPEGEQRLFTYTEEDMCARSQQVTAREEEAKRKKYSRPPVAATSTTPWRLPSMQP